MARMQQPHLMLNPLTRKQREAVPLVLALAINEDCRVQMEEAEVEVKSLMGLATKTLRTRFAPAAIR